MVTQVEFETLYSAFFLSGENYWAVYDRDGNFVCCVETLQEVTAQYG